LDSLLIAAAEAPSDIRIEYRDPIAKFGNIAIERLATPEWIGDPQYAAFAIRTISRAAEFGGTLAIPTLRRALDSVANDALRRDIEFELDRAGFKPPKSQRLATKRRGPTAVLPMALDDLKVGSCYRRRDLHLAGLGGNWQKGISYPASGTYCLLFSDPSKASDYGYRDAPIGDTGYRYFGEWDGPGDMNLAGGNQAILDRSPELYLFTDAACGRTFRGRYECVHWSWERTVRDNKELRAIVFELRRVS
jgi:hypothetical protein